jgi:hypothetical protein
MRLALPIDPINSSRVHEISSHLDGKKSIAGIHLYPNDGSGIVGFHAELEGDKIHAFGDGVSTYLSKSFPRLAFITEPKDSDEIQGCFARTDGPKLFVTDIHEAKRYISALHDEKNEKEAVEYEKQLEKRTFGLDPSDPNYKEDYEAAKINARINRGAPEKKISSAFGFEESDLEKARSCDFEEATPEEQRQVLAEYRELIIDLTKNCNRFGIRLSFFNFDQPDLRFFCSNRRSANGEGISGAARSL